MPLASFNLEGDAQLWYQLTEDDESLVTWQAFKDQLHARYDPTQYHDSFGDLTKLQQAGSIREYQTQFERLLFPAGRLSPERQVGGFVGGLKEGIKVDVQAAKPRTLSAATGLARLYEAFRSKKTATTTSTEPKKTFTAAASNPGRPIR